MKKITLVDNSKGQLFDTDITVDEKLKHIYKVVLDIRQMLIMCLLPVYPRGIHPANRSGISPEWLEDLASEIRNYNQDGERY